MKKTNSKSKKARRSARENLFLIVIVAALVVTLALALVQRFTATKEVNYIITSDCHVHAQDGTHVGTIEDLFGENAGDLVVTEDGHLHTADGAHVGNVSVPDDAAQTEDAAAADAAE